jgi:hypothetical protein
VESVDLQRRLVRQLDTLVRHAKANADTPPTQQRVSMDGCTDGSRHKRCRRVSIRRITIGCDFIKHIPLPQTAHSYSLSVSARAHGKSESSMKVRRIHKITSITKCGL